MLAGRAASPGLKRMARGGEGGVVGVGGGSEVKGTAGEGSEGCEGRGVREGGCWSQLGSSDSERFALEGRGVGNN